MRWEKLGLVFCPDRHDDWMISHAAVPFAVPLEGSLLRVYFSTRDRDNRSSVGWVLIDLDRPGDVLEMSRAPVLGPGRLGAFDDSGVTMSWLNEFGGRLFLYYTGWSLGVTVPFYFYVGLAESDGRGRTFYRTSPAPILGRSAVDPYLTASPCVLVEEGLWCMWYISCVRWELLEGGPRHHYHIRYAESTGGREWRRAGHVCLDFAGAEEYAFGRPCVLKDGLVYKMWYCYRGASYRIGYAESGDRLHWTRRDGDVGIDVAEYGWDSEMIAYPYVFDHRGSRFMLYNGNGYGRTGFGLAVLTGG
jgi:hypothetical protein